MGRTRRKVGGGPWRHGEDTCVFRPTVACKDSTDEYGDEYLSRVVLKDDRTYMVEKLLHQHFSPLITSGWVTAYDKVCEPKYIWKDRTRTASFIKQYGRRPTTGACGTKIKITDAASKNQLNLISKRLGDTFYDLDRSNLTPAVAFSLFQNAFSAAVELVPDAGPWIIHTDLHDSNILMNDATGRYALHDWGRSLVIKNPRSDESFIEGIVDFVDSYDPEEWGSIPATVQMPEECVNIIKRIYDLRRINPNDRNTIRIWSIYVLFLSVKNIIAQRIADRLIFNALRKHAATNASLKKSVNEIIDRFSSIKGFIIAAPNRLPASPLPQPSRTLRRNYKPCRSGHLRNLVTNRCRKIDGKEKPIPKSKHCPNGKILNPLTRRCVKLDGAIGRKLI